MDDLTLAIRLARDESAPGPRAALDRDVRQGRFVRVCTGAYVDAATWQGASAATRHRLVAHAASMLRRRRLVFSHWTAAVAWGLPVVGDLPVDAHVVAERASGGRTDERLVRHCVGIPAETHRVGGLEVTSLAQTVVDVARVAPFTTAVAVADAALRGDAGRPAIERRELVGLLGPSGRRGFARARDVVLFADPASGSPGESASRASMSLAGIPAPILQHRFVDGAGVMYSDFWWPGFNRIGEFDGAVKYDDPAFLAGRTRRQALLDEKEREDRLRALGPGVIRWRWDLALSPRRLRAHLLAGGIRPERYRNW